MILAFDVGNTNIVMGVIDEKKTYFLTRFATDPGKTKVEYAVLVKNILEIKGIEISKIDGGIISSVVPPLNSILSEVIELLT
ncbi:MAG: type III pantothenate kinase, partial [Lachnospiraceae bacterium]|nr:type III pantothenate kinase [Lachnospiraceae bacterium]